MEPTPPRLSEMLTCFLVRRLLELGRTEEACDEPARIGLDKPERERARRDESSPMRDLLVDTRIDLWSATGHAKRVEKVLAIEVPRARHEGRAARSVELALRRVQIEGSGGLASPDEQRFFGEITRRLPWTAAGPMAQLARAIGEPPELAEALTRRELELLRLLEGGLSNQQIAHQAGVSVTTIKWHLQNLYQKLNVSRRSAALVAARALNLLPR